LISAQKLSYGHSFYQPQVWLAGSKRIEFDAFLHHVFLLIIRIFD